MRTSKDNQQTSVSSEVNRVIEMIKTGKTIMPTDAMWLVVEIMRLREQSKARRATEF